MMSNLPQVKNKQPRLEILPHLEKHLPPHLENLTQLEILPQLLILHHLKSKKNLQNHPVFQILPGRYSL